VNTAHIGLAITQTRVGASSCDLASSRVAYIEAHVVQASMDAQ
jgi:hypothetical protein